MKKAASVIPVFFPHPDAEPHFVVFRRGSKRSVQPGKDVISFAGHQDASDRNLRHTARRELREESGIRFDPKRVIAQVHVYFTRGRRGKAYVHLVQGAQLDQLHRTIQAINEGRHNEFESARVVSLSALREELGGPHCFALPEFGRDVVELVSAWHLERSH
ncbi:NUDIX domain-containing protein [Candidatus Micrarchaeota archaeon]|nr:NUDIX domain-containing protein [Candidatus Micrarchaeota archaeon]